PRNHFPLAQCEGPTVLLAGGIGITPILAMARALERQGRPYELHYFTRSRALMPLLSVIEQELDRSTVWLHFDDEPETRQDLESLLSTRSSDAQLY
ncbi:oxidoreductase, partial [Mesorhizobium caraganae]|nr:oxidoreductase [Mesorhizobium caraganae]